MRRCDGDGVMRGRGEERRLTSSSWRLAALLMRLPLSLSIEEETLPNVNSVGL